MVKFDYPFRQATPDDAKVLAKFVNVAGEGLPLYLWQNLAEGRESPWEIGYSRARKDSGGFSYRNAVFRMVNEDVAACLVGYALDDDPPATNYSEIFPMFVPLQQLEDLAPGTWYINALATNELYRGRGYGNELLALAEEICTSLGKRALSLIVADTNQNARRLYRRAGYRDVSKRPMIKDQWQHPGRDWVLMVKNL